MEVADFLGAGRLKVGRTVGSLKLELFCQYLSVLLSSCATIEVEVEESRISGIVRWEFVYIHVAMH